MKDIRLRMYGATGIAVLVFIVVGLVIGPCNRSLAFLIAGVVFELFGVLRLMAGISAAAREHRQPGFLQLMRWDRKRRSVTSAISGNTAIAFGGTAIGTVQPPLHDLAARILQLEKDLTHLREEFPRLIRDAAGRFRAEIQEQGRHNAAAMAELKGTVVTELWGQGWTEYVSAVFFLAGLILTNFNDQLAAWFQEPSYSHPCPPIALRGVPFSIPPRLDGVTSIAPVLREARQSCQRGTRYPRA